MTKAIKTPNFNLSMVMTHLGGIIAVICWGLSFVATKVVMDGGIGAGNESIGLSPTEAYIYRFVFAYLIILLFSHKRIFCNTMKDEAIALLCGLSSGSIYFIAENTALEYTYASNVSLLSATSPLVTVLIIGLMYKSERPGRGMIIGSIIAFMGVSCVIMNSASSLEIKPIGDLLAFSTAFCWAFYSILIKGLNVVYDALFITRKTFFYGLVTSLPFLAFDPTLHNPVEVFTIGWPWVDGSLAFLILGPSVLAFYLWSVTIKKMGPVVSNNYLYLQPVVTVIASAIILGEAISALGYIGFGLILFGLWVGSYIERRMGIRSL